MCAICKDWLIDKMEIQELLDAARELIATADTEEEKEHIHEQMIKALRRKRS